MVDELVVATLNLRNIADRWGERLPLLLADMAALQPDLLGLQECVFAVQQDRLLAGAGEARYEIFRGWAGRPEYGNSVLVREGLSAGPAERLELGRNRSALRVPAGTAGGASLTFAVAHLHHLPEDLAVREEQARALVDWLEAEDGPLVVVGDFNADPAESAYGVMAEAGFRSAHLEANGTEPAVTWPSGIVAPGVDDEGEPGCLDYIWLRGPIRALDCRLAWNRPAAEDPTLYPSDHFGLIARVRLGAAPTSS